MQRTGPRSHEQGLGALERRECEGKWARIAEYGGFVRLSGVAHIGIDIDIGISKFLTWIRCRSSVRIALLGRMLGIINTAASPSAPSSPRCS